MRTFPALNALEVYAKLLAPGGKLLMLTGNSEDLAGRDLGF